MSDRYSCVNVKDLTFDESVFNTEYFVSSDYFIARTHARTFLTVN